jgi:hypothetical protein
MPLEAARNDPSPKEPSLPAGRSVQRVQGAGAGSKISTGDYSDGKASRIIPQIIEKIETCAS